MHLLKSHLRNLLCLQFFLGGNIMVVSRIMGRTFRRGLVFSQKIPNVSVLFLEQFLVVCRCILDIKNHIEPINLLFVLTWTIQRLATHVDSRCDTCLFVGTLNELSI